jgi:hypothetical protein
MVWKTSCADHDCRNKPEAATNPLPVLEQLLTHDGDTFSRPSQCKVRAINIEEADMPMLRVFCLVHGTIGVPQQVFGVRCVFGAKGDADAGADPG